jgi:hypothetical protein
MTAPYRTVDVSGWELAEDEPLGTKQKRWLREPVDLGGRRWLFKRRQSESTGDDWAERIAAECASAIRIPRADVELATRVDERGVRHRGVIALDFRESGPSDDLTLGNSLLKQIDPDYSASSRSRIAYYTLERAFEVLDQPFVGVPTQWQLPRNVITAADVFTGYLMFDALIANQDRNHKNWGVTERPSDGLDRRFELVPSFDHGSSLGRNLGDDERAERLTTRDRGYAIDAFASKAKSKFRVDNSAGRHVTTFGAFRWALDRCHSAGRAWLDELRRVDDSALRAMVLPVPTTIMSASAKEFATRLLILNRATLLASNLES